MSHEVTDNSSLFLWTVPARRGDRRFALIAALVSVIAFFAVLPFAKIQLAQVPAFIPIYESALVINDLMTAALLFGQFGILRSRALFALACGYLFTSFSTIVHALTFPDLFVPGGLLGAGMQTTAWVYMFWHGVFPLTVSAYALLKPKDIAAAWRVEPRTAVIAGIFFTALAVCGFAMLATLGHDLLPVIMNGHRVNPTLRVVVSVVWTLSFIALFLLARRRPWSVLETWLMVTMSAWICEIALSALFNAGRFDLGYYAGRIYGLIASSLVLIVLLLENSILYARLANAHERERRKNSELIEANKELDAFSYSVSHDLRTPLRIVDGYGKMLEEDYGKQLDAEGRRLLDIVRANSRQMGQLIDDLLALSRLGRQPLKAQTIHMDRMVETIISELAADIEGRAIDFRVAPLGTVEADPILLKQALINLIGNAIKFTRNRNPAVIEIGRTAKEDTFTYFVKDNGAGFDMRYYDKLFGVFQRLHSADDFQGTGVGLAIVRRIATRHDGKTWAESTLGEGATFYLSLPIKEYVHA